MVKRPPNKIISKVTDWKREGEREREKRISKELNVESCTEPPAGAQLPAPTDPRGGSPRPGPSVHPTTGSRSQSFLLQQTGGACATRFLPPPEPRRRPPFARADLQSPPAAAPRLAASRGSIHTFPVRSPSGEAASCPAAPENRGKAGQRKNIPFHHAGTGTRRHPSTSRRDQPALAALGLEAARGNFCEAEKPEKNLCGLDKFNRKGESHFPSVTYTRGSAFQ